MYQLIKKDKTSRARLGVLTTEHGQIEAPFFMPVGTNATVKSVSVDHLLEFDTQIVLSNTYHLYLRPGTDVIEHAGGLHKFMSWDRPILTDSGGYQVFSLSKLRKISDQGVEFQSHIDGSRHFLDPEKVVDIQRSLGTDIMMPLDECAPYPCERKEAERSVKRTTAWARRSRDYFLKGKPKWHRQFQFGIIQGATFEDLRQRSAEEILSIDFDGYAIGGVSVGEPVKLMFDTLTWVMPMMPDNRPRYFMGIGLPDQIVKAVGEGIDMFDTCIPTRYGRHGSSFTHRGKIIIRNAEFIKDQGPIDETCGCHVCRKYSRSYLRHLMASHETLGLTLVSYHNVYFYVNLMRRIREAIREDRFAEFREQFLQTYQSELAEKK